MQSKSNHSRKSSSRRRNSPRGKKRFTNKISDHFSKNDFTCKESGKFKISLGLIGALEELRTLVKKRITIVKGYECSDVAEKKGSLKRNLHTQGLAADIFIEGLSLVEIFMAAEKIEPITGIGLNKKENYIHIETRKVDRRLWVEENNEEIELTEENRTRYLEEN